MSWQNIHEQFQETPDRNLLGVIPVAAIARGEHETLFVTSIARYADESTLSVQLVLGPDHPEHEWRNRGRPGHPFMIAKMQDDLGTEYVAMPGGRGGGMYYHDFSFRIRPAIPEDARTVTLSFSDPQWDARAIQRFYESGEAPAPRWNVTVDLSRHIPATEVNDAR